jgi:hypothetical protein
VTETLRHSADSEMLRRLVAPEFLLKLKERGIPYFRQGEFYDGLSVPGVIKRGKCYFFHGVSTAKHAVAATIARIGAIYGAGSVDPYHALYGARAELIELRKVDPLASLAEAVSAICHMRRPEGDGGVAGTPKEQLDALPVLKEAARDLTAYIASIERMRIAA